MQHHVNPFPIAAALAPSRVRPRLRSDWLRLDRKPRCKKGDEVAPSHKDFYSD
jgi:hypothetical protein